MPELLERLQRALADRYGIARELGQGGMAVVYLAEDKRHIVNHEGVHHPADPGNS